MYKVDFDSFFIQLQCPFLYHASVETYLTTLGTAQNWQWSIQWTSSAFGPSVQVSFSWSAEAQMDKILWHFKYWKFDYWYYWWKDVAKKYTIKFHLGGQLLSPINLIQTLPAPPLSISQHCMSGARFQNPHNEKVSFTNLILLLF